MKKRAVRKLKKVGAVTKPSVAPEKIVRAEELSWDEVRALEMFLGKEGMRKTQDGYYLECESERQC